MNTSEIAAKVAEAHSVSKAHAKTLIEAFLKELISEASSGAEVTLPGFGKFKVKESAEREGRNPANGEKITIAASKKLTFAPAKAVKDTLNGTRLLRSGAFLGLIAVLLVAATPAWSGDAQPELSGDLRIHDPSVIDVDGRYVAFGSGEQGLTRGAVRLKTSLDGLRWKDAGAIGAGAFPLGGKDALGYQPTNVWAPSVSLRGGVVSLYYALSSFGSNVSAIGLMTNASFDPSAPAAGWTDQGLVLKSTAKDDFNAIDPFRVDLADGRAFLAFGSFWSGVKLRELDPRSGKLRSEDTPTLALASRHGGAVEAPSIVEHAGRFYLFVSFDQCCKGVASTYTTRVGRAERIEGPYKDKAGVDMLDGGGSVVLASQGRFIGPGGEEPVRNASGDMLAYHYYDGAAGGVAKLQMAPIRWTAEGWPELAPYPR